MEVFLKDIFQDFQLKQHSNDILLQIIRILNFDVNIKFVNIGIIVNII